MKTEHVLQLREDLYIYILRFKSFVMGIQQEKITSRSDTLRKNVKMKGNNKYIFENLYEQCSR